MSLARRERVRRRQARHRRIRRAANYRTAGLIGIGVSAAVALGVTAYVLNVVASVPPLDRLKPAYKGRSSEVFAADGSRLGFIQSDVFRTPISLAEIPVSLRQATVAIEDARFYSHGAIDPAAIARAAFKNARRVGAYQGGSTLTQQLVKQIYVAPERSIERKIREAKIAAELEKRLTKDQILNRYLNTVPYGTVEGVTILGVEAAAQTYFSRPAKELTVKQSALIAGLTQAPSLYNPLRNPQAARKRRNDVLKAMAGSGFISPERAARLALSRISVNRGNLYTKIREPYFFDYVKDELVERYGVNDVRRGGLKVHTTVDPKFQEAGRAAVKGVFPYPDDPSSALVAIDPKNGNIRAMASSSNYSDSKFNLAEQGRRQPGSTFKTFALVAAMKKGVDPDQTTYESKQLALPLPGGGIWNVSTYSGSYGGNMTLTKATLTSDNTVYAQLALDIGPKDVAKTAREMGVRTKLDALPSETLGGLTRGVSPLEMASAYSTLAGGGVYHRPRAVTKVVFPSGLVRQFTSAKGKRVLDEGVASEATAVLEKNVLQGTGTGASFGCPAAGKTGTTDDFSDAWFAGYTPELATAVWVGYPNERRSMSSVHGVSVAGGTFPADIWREFMGPATGGECADFPVPAEGAVLDRFFGKYATSGAATSDESDEPSTAGTDTPTDTEKSDEETDSAGTGNGADDGAGGGTGGTGGTGGVAPQ